jgi:serine/threonine-protein kinase RsbW
VAGPLVGPVLRRVVGMLAARADLPLDRLDDAVLVADLIAARAPAHVTEGRVDVTLDPGPRSLSLRIGPLRPGGGEALIVDAAVPGVGNVIEQLADELSVSPEDEGEFLHVRLVYAATAA